MLSEPAHGLRGFVLWRRAIIALHDCSTWHDQVSCWHAGRQEDRVHICASSPNEGRPDICSMCVQNQTSLNWFYLWLLFLVLIPATLLGVRGVWKKTIQLVHCCSQMLVFLLTIYIAGVIPQTHNHVIAGRAVRSCLHSCFCLMRALAAGLPVATD